MSNGSGGHDDLGAMEVAGLFSPRPAEIDASSLGFYVTMDIPGLGERPGYWDIRSGMDTYLGRTSYDGASVLEIGTANGLLAFEMERRGASVVAVDLPLDGEWDLFPRAGFDIGAFGKQQRGSLRGIRNAFWFAHRAFDSKVRLIESHVRELDPRVTGFDVAIVGNVMQHLRDPVGLILDLAGRAGTVVVTEADWFGGENDDKPVMRLFTPLIAGGALSSWFQLSPQFVEDLLVLKGFSIGARDVHYQPFSPKIGDEPTLIRHYTITATRAAAECGATP